MELFILSLIALPITLLVISKFRLDLPPIRQAELKRDISETSDDFQVARAA